MSESDAETDQRDDEKDRTERLRSVFRSVTGGDAGTVVERQHEEPRSREIREEPADAAVGPAEHHGLDDAIGDPEPAD